MDRTNIGNLSLNGGREMRSAFRALSSEKDYRYWFDPFWVRAEPYRIKVKRGGSAEGQLHVRNFRRTRQTHTIAIHTPPGLEASPAAIRGILADEQRSPYPFHLNAAQDARIGVHLVAFDTTLDLQRYGELFDCIVEVVE